MVALILVIGFARLKLPFRAETLIGMVRFWQRAATAEDANTAMAAAARAFTILRSDDLKKRNT